jgi:hypothetical protein
MYPIISRGGFNLNDLDHKFSDFIKFLLISKQHITSRNYNSLERGIFDILNDLGSTPKLKISLEAFYQVRWKLLKILIKIIMILYKRNY